MYAYVTSQALEVSASIARRPHAYDDARDLRKVTVDISTVTVLIRRAKCGQNYMIIDIKFAS
jgi:hypothetical protein